VAGWLSTIMRKGTWRSPESCRENKLTNNHVPSLDVMPSVKMGKGFGAKSNFQKIATG